MFIPFCTLHFLTLNMNIISSYIHLSILIFTLLLSYCYGGKRNIVFVIIDDLRPALGCYGDENAYTPNIDNFARKSYVFKSAYCQQALCAPSRNSLLTSRRPDTLRLYDFYNYWRNFSGNFTTLPQFFKENGYETMSIGKVFHPGAASNWNDDMPYSWSKTPYHPPTEKYKEAHVCGNESSKLARNLVCPVTVEEQPGKSLPDIQSLQRARLFLKDKHDKPFFLGVGFHKPHIPLKFPREYLDFHPIKSVILPAYRWHPPLMPDIAWNPWTDVRNRDDIVALNLTFPFGLMPDYYAKIIRQSYYASVTYIDDLFGQLMKDLELLQLLDNTIIVLVGDHGWSLGEHGEWAKYSNFEESVRVPLIIYIPDLTTNPLYYSQNDAIQNAHGHKEIWELVELVDIFPTLAEISGIEPIPSICVPNSTQQLCTEGISLLPIIQKTAIQWKTGAFSQYPRPGRFPSRHPNSDKPRLSQIMYMGYSLRTARHRFTEWVHFNKKTFTPDWEKVVDEELYDHVLDPNENLNLADRPQLSDLIKLLKVQLHSGWRESLPKDFLQ